MRKDGIKKEILKFDRALKARTAEVNIMFVDQNNSRKQRYKGYMLKTKLEDIEPVLTGSLSYITKELDERTLEVYDLEITIDETVQTVNKNDVIYGDELLQEITVNYTEENVVSENTDLQRIKFIVIQIYAEEKSLYLFKKYIHPTTSYKTSEKYTFSGGVLKPFNDVVITINTVVDTMLFDDVYYVFNRNSFNSMFAYKDVFAKILNENIGAIRESGLLDNSDGFVADCESDGRYLTRLTKVILAKGFEEVSIKKKEIPNVIKEFNLSLQTLKDGQIQYRGKEDIPELLNLLLRHYVIDALTSNKMIAAAIQEYQAGKRGGNSK